MEPTTGRRVDRAWHVAGQDDPLAADLRVWHRDRGHQGGRVWMFLLAEQFPTIGELRDAAEIHHGDAVADVLHDAHVVGHEDVGQAEFALEGLQEVEHLGLDGDVQGGDRLIAHDEVWLQDQRSCDPDALALAAAELMRVATGVVRLETHHVHHPAHLGAPLRGGSKAVDAQALADAVADRRAWVQARVRVLEDDLDAPAVGLEGAPGDRRQVHAVEMDGPGRRLDEPQQQAPDRRLAAARLAHETQGLATLDIEADAVDGLDLADRSLEDAAVHREVLDQVANLDQRSVGGAVGRAHSLGRDGCRVGCHVEGWGCGHRASSGRAIRPPAASW